MLDGRGRPVRVERRGHTPVHHPHPVGRHAEDGRGRVGGRLRWAQDGVDVTQAAAEHAPSPPVARQARVRAAAAG